MPIYTLRGCTIEVPKGGRSAKATRHGDKPESKSFSVLAVKDAPTPEVQAQRWAMGLPEWMPEAFAAGTVVTIEGHKPGVAPDPRREPQTPVRGDTRSPVLAAGPQSIEESITDDKPKGEQ